MYINQWHPFAMKRKNIQTRSEYDQPKRPRGRGLSRGRGPPRGHGASFRPYPRLPRGPTRALRKPSYHNHMRSRRHESSTPTRISPQFRHSSQPPAAMPFERRQSTASASSAPKSLPFGFDIEPYMDFIIDRYDIGKHAYSIRNPIIGFQDDTPIYLQPKRKYTIENVVGLKLEVSQPSPQKKFISCLHSRHTESMYRMAWEILSTLEKQPRCHIQQIHSDEPFHVDISKAHRSTRHNSEDIVYVGAVHSGDLVVLKTSCNKSTMLKYILDAVIHCTLMESAPSHVPALKFVRLTPDDKLVICSEQLKIPPVASWMQTLNTKHPKTNLDYLVFKMLKGTCLSIRRLQKNAKFTHRDAHWKCLL